MKRKRGESAEFTSAERGESPLVRDDLFARAVADVKPLAKRERYVQPRKKAVPRPVRAEWESPPESGSQDAIELKGDDTSGRIDGVSQKELRRLARGDIAYEARLDLHGDTQEEALARVTALVTSARQAGKRCVLIVTGHGQHSREGRAVLREALPRWLQGPLSAHVLAYCTAPASQGGAGAFYVYLRSGKRNRKRP